jgi:hypothetical protein
MPYYYLRLLFETQGNVIVNFNLLNTSSKQSFYDIYLISAKLVKLSGILCKQ